MASICERFLSMYKEYEGLMRSMRGTDPKDAEESLPSPSDARMRMCRQFRNYLVHVDDPGFLEPTDKMMRFLQSWIDMLKLEGDPVKKHLKKPEACMLSESDKMSDASEKFAKLKCTWLPVRYKDGHFGMLSVFDTVGQRGTMKLSVVRTKALKPCYCSPTAGFMSLDPDRFTLCTSDGTPEGKLLGMVWKKDRPEWV